MSIEVGMAPLCTGRACAVALVIKPHARNLGEFVLRRVLPASERPLVGPFVFFDHFGPAEFPPGEGIQVRPHTHIGLATVTYLKIEKLIHRDSLGYTQPIQTSASSEPKKTGVRVAAARCRATPSSSRCRAIAA